MISKILLVEDDENFGYILKEYLEINDLDVKLTRNGQEGLEAFQKESYQLCILDIMMPVKDGYTLAKEIREIDIDVPFIFLTAKALKIDKLKGFRLGCDDFIVKPIDEEIFIARVKAIIKRAGFDRPEIADSYKIGKYLFDYANQSLVLNNKLRRLTKKESQILLMLCDKKNQLLDRKKALNTIWGENDIFNRKSMDVFIHKIRRYLDQDPSVKIINVHGKGFVLEIT